MQLNFWLLPDIFFPYLSTKLPPITYSRAVTAQTFLPIPLSKNPNRKALRALRTRCLTDSVFASHFWFLEGV